MKSTTLLATALMAAAQAKASWLASPVVNARVPTKVQARSDGIQSPSVPPIPGGPTSHGCYTSKGNMTLHSPVQYIASGSCSSTCASDGYWVMALHGDDCYCGYSYPPVDDVTKDSSCSYPCLYYNKEACGGITDGTFYSVFNTGVNIEATDLKPATTSAASSTTAASTTAASTTAPASETTSSSSSGGGGGKKSSTNTAAIAAGVVVGVVALAAAAGGLYFFLRRRRNAELQEDHRRNAAVNAFINGAKAPSSNDSVSMSDSRLDPVMAHRRLSDGSIADNQDYSRRILRVTNA